MTNVGPVATEASDTHPIVVLLVPEILLVVVQPVVDGLGHVLRHLDPAAVAAPTTAVIPNYISFVISDIISLLCEISYEFSGYHS